MLRILVVWIVLGAALSGLYRWNGKLEEAEKQGRDTAHRIGRFIPASERQRLTVAWLSVGSRGLNPLVYRPAGGVWRCMSHFGAICSQEAIDGLQKALFEAEGVVRSTDPARAADYGLGVETSLMVRLHGTGGNVLFEVELGRRVEGENACYVRRGDHPAVWEIDTDPWSFLSPPAPGLPPLLDPHVIPRGWPGPSRRVDRVAVEHTAGRRFELTLHEIRISEEEMRQGKQPYEWRFTIDGETAAADPQAAMSFTSFLFRTPYLSVLDPGRFPELGLDPPAARVILYPAEGEPAEIRIGGATASDRVAVANMNTRSLFEVAPQVADLLAPRPELLSAGVGGNPWEIWLRR